MMLELLAGVMVFRAAVAMRRKRPPVILFVLPVQPAAAENPDDADWRAWQRQMDRNWEQ